MPQPDTDFVKAETEAVKNMLTKTNENSVEKELEETSSIEPEKDISEYPYDKREVLEEYADYRNPEIRSFVSGVLDGTENKNTLYLENVSDRAAEDIMRVTGVNTHGFKTGFEKRMVEHIENRHGINGVADKSMANIEDWERIQYVLNNYDNIEAAGNTQAYTTIKNNGRSGLAKTVMYSKAINGTFYVIEAVPDTKSKTVYVVSAYISKSKNGLDGSADVTSPGVTSETDSATTHPNDSIPQPRPVVKFEKDGSIMLPTAEDEWNAALERSFAKTMGVLPGFSDVTTEYTEMTGRVCGVSEENIGIAVRLSHALGVKVAFYRDMESAERGQYIYETGVIWVNSKYADVFSNVFGHELTHRIENSKFYAKLDKFVERQLRAEGKDINTLIREKQDSYGRLGETLSAEKARAEVVARYVGEILLNNEAVITDIARAETGLTRIANYGSFGTSAIKQSTNTCSR